MKVTSSDGRVLTGVWERPRCIAGAEFAALGGASGATVDKALVDFALRGWLRVDVRSVVLLDPERLARRAG